MEEFKDAAGQQACFSDLLPVFLRQHRDYYAPGHGRVVSATAYRLVRDEAIQAFRATFDSVHDYLELRTAFLIRAARKQGLDVDAAVPRDKAGNAFTLLAASRAYVNELDAAFCRDNFPAGEREAADFAFFLQRVDVAEMLMRNEIERQCAVTETTEQQVTKEQFRNLLNQAASDCLVVRTQFRPPLEALAKAEQSRARVLQAFAARYSSTEDYLRELTADLQAVLDNAGCTFTLNLDSKGTFFALDDEDGSGSFVKMIDLFREDGYDTVAAESALEGLLEIDLRYYECFDAVKRFADRKSQPTARPA